MSIIIHRMRLFVVTMTVVSGWWLCFLFHTTLVSAFGIPTPSRRDSYRLAAAVDASNLALLSKRGRKAVETLVQFDTTADDSSQHHVYGDWPAVGTDDEGKKRLAEQLADLEESYPGGLPAYLQKAQILLQESALGVNPFDEYKALLPVGESLQYATDAFDDYEQKGLDVCGDTVFCLVAGGLGERLGYSGIKLSLDTCLLTEQCYLEAYCEYILAVQQQCRDRTGRQDLRIPLVIMTSGDTDAPTRELLKMNNNFGMDDDMVKIVTQDKVAALKDGSAGLALDDDRWTVQTKPHGHGDVHHLLFKEGLVDQWQSEGKKYIVFLQDTNLLVINSILPSLGVSEEKGFHMNSICIPRLAGEAAGAITRLEYVVLLVNPVFVSHYSCRHKSDPDKSLVINVEYNQLDPLLQSQGGGDVPDPDTGYSPFPGNANNLVIEMNAYAETLKGEDQGVVLEFVNPKYKDSSRTDFKKPTRLECMMQDIPKLFQKEMGQRANIGFTMFERWLTFSPAKNALDAGQESVAAGNTAPGTLSSAESDKYVQNQRKLSICSGVVEADNTLVNQAGIPVTPGPRIVMSPSFAVTRRDVRDKIVNEDGDDVLISTRSSLILDGPDVTVRKLDLDGALVIRAVPGGKVTVDGLNVTNQGWTFRDIDANDESLPEHVRIRGYVLDKKETAEYVVTEPGNYVLDDSGLVKTD